MIFLPKPTQRLLEVRTRIVKPETATPSRRFAGRVIASPSLSGVVQSTITGRYIAPDGGVTAIGTKVRAGDLLGRVAASFASIDASQIAQAMAELDQQIAIARAKLSRLEPLLRTQAVAAAQVDDARLTLEGLIKRRNDLATAKAQPEDLRSPVDGVIASARVMSGQVIGPSEQVFQIIDPSSLMVEALVFGLGSREVLSNATALLGSGRTIALRYVGRSRALQQQYARVQFAVVDGDGTLDVGLPVKVVAATGAQVTGIILPRAALTQAPNGQTVVFVQKEPELFEPKPVRVEPFDAGRVRVLAGIGPGETIVVQNAPLVAQIR
jgi:RND family efflux transporter MFP subunit